MDGEDIAPQTKGHTDKYLVEKERPIFSLDFQ
jgi:hypothetical protein